MIENFQLHRLWQIEIRLQKVLARKRNSALFANLPRQIDKVSADPFQWGPDYHRNVTVR